MMRQQQQQQMFDAQQQQHMFDAANAQAMAQRNYGLEEQKLLQQVQQHKQMMEFQRLQSLGMLQPTLQQQMMMQRPGTMDADYAQKVHDAVMAEILKATQVPLPARPKVSPVEQQLFPR